MKLEAKLKKLWRTQPLLSVATALLLLVIVQTVVMTFDFTLAFAPEFAFVCLNCENIPFIGTFRTGENLVCLILQRCVVVIA